VPSKQLGPLVQTTLWPTNQLLAVKKTKHRLKMKPHPRFSDEAVTKGNTGNTHGESVVNAPAKNAKTKFISPLKRHLRLT
jgi:hypothetical protein